ncbi:MAG: sigma 54-interacting transcriptional regulator [Deltaproteobacteria bacterium]|nr:sigma 54-interacting transcriptional regulator [Deltaproteobacteria bacterium]
MSINESDFFREVVKRINSSLEIETSLARCIRYLKDFMPVEEMRLSLHDWDTFTLRTIATATVSGGKRMNVVTPLSPLQTKDSMKAEPDVKIVNDPKSDPVSRFHLTTQSRNVDNSSLIIMRLKIGGERIGNLILHAAGKGKYQEKHARLVSLLNEPFAMAFTNAIRYQEIVKLKDMLTDDNWYLHRELLAQSGEEIVGANAGLKKVTDMVNDVAPLNCPVLLLGETGVGKELIANAIHNLSPRRNAPLIKVNCGAIPESLLDSELFGHEKGAFTGAVARMRGRFERAEKGTIFLDEIGELPPSAQVRMLRVLQNKEIERVGGSEVISVDIRILASTHRNLENMVRSNLFREDLFFRLNVFPIKVPPLRERPQDIPPLVRYFVERKSMEMKLNAPPPLAPGAIETLLSYHWPGNVRELENVVERSLILNKTGPLLFESFIPEINESAPDLINQRRHPLTLDQAVSQHIKTTLAATNGKVQGPGGAAALLGIHPSTLRNKMKKLGIPYGRRKATS